MIRGFLECHFSQYCSPQIKSCKQDVCHQSTVRKIRNACLSWSLPRWLWHFRDTTVTVCHESMKRLAFGRQQTWLPQGTQESLGNCTSGKHCNQEVSSCWKNTWWNLFCWICLLYFRIVWGFLVPRNTIESSSRLQEKHSCESPLNS